MSEPFIEKHAVSTELRNVNREKHKLKSHHVCRRDRESSRIPIRSLEKSKEQKQKGSIGNLSMHVFFRVYPCHLHCTVM